MDPEIKCKCAIHMMLRFSNWLTESLSKGKLIHEAVVQIYVYYFLHLLTHSDSYAFPIMNHTKTSQTSRKHFKEPPAQGAW